MNQFNTLHATKLPGSRFLRLLTCPCKSRSRPAGREMALISKVSKLSWVKYSKNITKILQKHIQRSRPSQVVNWHLLRCTAHAVCSSMMKHQRSYICSTVLSIIHLPHFCELCRDRFFLNFHGREKSLVTLSARATTNLHRP